MLKEQTGKLIEEYGLEAMLLALADNCSDMADSANRLGSTQLEKHFTVLSLRLAFLADKHRKA